MTEISVSKGKIYFPFLGEKWQSYSPGMTSQLKGKNKVQILAISVILWYKMDQHKMNSWENAFCPEEPFEKFERLSQRAREDNEKIVQGNNESYIPQNRILYTHI